MINLTPHPIVLQKDDGTRIQIMPSGAVARVSTTDTVTGDHDGIPVVRRSFGAVTGLPDGDAPCIVSAMVLAAVPGRAGVYAPDTGPTAIRDQNGRIVAVTRLVAA